MGVGVDLAPDLLVVLPLRRVCALLGCATSQVVLPVLHPGQLNDPPQAGQALEISSQAPTLTRETYLANSSGSLLSKWTRGRKAA
jgi:hypothetical protein